MIEIDVWARILPGVGRVARLSDEIFDNVSRFFVRLYPMNIYRGLTIISWFIPTRQG